ncbi:hypothetical protein NFI95_11720 [Acetobacteraceae bacterium KSS8]|uniref:(2Fe-2S) ferredoxin domain-containing protein n=1 Tax=Endosaccharibacter trunci TaxID=2812733 RepID=A0ABT1W897_9PROT|nr:hypothetical protein [Acetobacteraceae bacterium KSS8]
MGEKHKAVPGEITVARGPWTTCVLLCGKCGKKLDGGFGDKRDESLASVLKQLLRDREQRKWVRVIQVGCLDICPRGGIAAMRGDAPGEMMIIPAGMDAASIAQRLIGGGLTEPATPGS